MIQRRAFLTGLASALAAPAIVRAGSLMPVRGIVTPSRTAEDLINDVLMSVGQPPSNSSIWRVSWGELANDIWPGLKYHVIEQRDLYRA